MYMLRVINKLSYADIAKLKKKPTSYVYYAVQAVRNLIHKYQDDGPVVDSLQSCERQIAILLREQERVRSAEPIDYKALVSITDQLRKYYEQWNCLKGLGTSEGTNVNVHQHTVSFKDLVVKANEKREEVEVKPE